MPKKGIGPDRPGLCCMRISGLAQTLGDDPRSMHRMVMRYGLPWAFAE